MRSVVGAVVLLDRPGTRYRVNGNYDEMYGRLRELDLIAHQFMNKVMFDGENYMQDNKEYRMGLMKTVLDMVDAHPEASRYFNMMKSIMKRGDPSIMEELSSLKQKLKSAEVGSKE